jgi:hypothetical protein
MIAAPIYRLADLVCRPLECVVAGPHVVHVLLDCSPHVCNVRARIDPGCSCIRGHGRIDEVEGESSCVGIGQVQCAIPRYIPTTRGSFVIPTGELIFDYSREY